MLLARKTALVTGIANKNSIAWSVAKAWGSAGANVALTISDERFREKVESAIDSEWDSKMKRPLVLCCDVEDNAQVTELFSRVTDQFEGNLDAMLHSIAYAPREAIHAQSLLQVSRQDFAKTMEISSYSLLALSQGAMPLLCNGNGGSVTTLTFNASNTVVSGYGVMAPAKASLETISRYLAVEHGTQNVRFNCLSAGPINTLAARGIPNFKSMMKLHAEQAPLKRNVTREEVANTALFLASDMSSGITGQTIHVDAGHSIA